MDWSLLLERRLPYWLGAVLLWWLITFQILGLCEKVIEDFEEGVQTRLFGFAEDNYKLYRSGPVLIGVIATPIVIGGLFALLLTSRALPPDAFAWLNYVLAPMFTCFVKLVTPMLACWNSMIPAIRNFRKEDAEYSRDLTKHNQFLRGESNFNVIGCLIGFIPAAINFGWVIKGIQRADEHEDDEDFNRTRERLYEASVMLGWAGTIPLFWFLIPVARHSVMLAAMGWSPVHALRIHVWSGYTSFVLVFLHGLGLLIVYMKYDTHYTLADHFFPPDQCWGKDAYNSKPRPKVEDAPEVPPENETCKDAWFNLTGTISLLAFIVLWATSINWVRRRYYRLFYITHIGFGVVMLVFAFMHFSFIAFYSAPSILFYLGSTIPTLVQALAARFRGGHRIVKVVSLHDAGGCVEVHIAVDDESSVALKKVPCPYVKLLVPSISMVWHPFTVFQKEGDNQTVRFLFRRVGPYTNALATKLEYERPIMILDGFYRGSDRHLEATQHDHVSIICGGVAITPYLSLLPRIFRSMKERDDGRTTSITLLWSCREQGLMDFVLENYIHGFIAMSQEIENLEFKIKVFHTGIWKSSTSSATLKIDDRSNPTLNSDSSDKSEEIDDENVEPGYTQGEIAGMKVQQGANSSKFTMDETDNSSDNRMETSTGSTSSGMNMELARFMPLRFSKIWQNIAIFLIFNGYLYVGLHWLVSNYGYSRTTFSDMGKMTWVSLLLVPIAVAFGVLSECVFYFLKNKLPQVREEVYVFSEGKDVSDLAAVATFIEVFKGRPGAEDLFEDMKNAECPGIFLCGPVPLSKMVWKEARKENSVLGFTRYCIYEEPFEM